MELACLCCNPLPALSSHWYPQTGTRQAHTRCVATMSQQCCACMCSPAVPKQRRQKCLHSGQALQTMCLQPKLTQCPSRASPLAVAALRRPHAGLLKAAACQHISHPCDTKGVSSMWPQRLQASVARGWLGSTAAAGSAAVWPGAHTADPLPHIPPPLSPFWRQLLGVCRPAQHRCASAARTPAAASALEHHSGTPRLAACTPKGHRQRSAIHAQKARPRMSTAPGTPWCRTHAPQAQRENTFP